MSKQDQRKKKRSPVARILQWGTTVLLVICTLFCFFAVVSSTVKKDISLFGYRLFYVVSGSMEPDIPVGALLVVGECDSYGVDDVITFYSQDESIQGYPNTHRIIDVVYEDGSARYITKGDANDAPDDTPVKPEDVIGKVHISIGNGFIRRAMEFLGTPIGFFAVILLPILLIALICMKDFAKAMKEEMQNAALEALKKEQAEKEERDKNEKNKKGKTK